MAAAHQPRLTPEEYLELDRAAECRNEYFNGRMYAMAGGTHRHALIIGNCTRELGNELKKRPCLVTPTDVRIRTSPGGLYTYPDIVVVCGDSRYVDGRRDTLLNPTLLIEVLSPSTEAYDRGLKSAQYRTLETLEEYALVSQHEPRVEIFRRQTAGWLFSEVVGLDTSCHFASVECTLSLADIYDKVTFEEGEPAA
jgi:Uma2 family endonuclease